MDEDDIAEIFAPSEAEDDADIADFLMLNALVAAGVDQTCAELYTNTVCALPNKTSFVEVYGRGHIMAQANGPRRSLNITGLNALDLRTYKANGEPWDFSKKTDRVEAETLIEVQKPMWVIGSPQCNKFSSWQYVNYRDLNDEEINTHREEGRVHLRFAARLYRRQVRAGRYFPHEHPSGATSWKEPSMKAIRHLPEVDTSKCDQCMYGCKAHSTLNDPELPKCRLTCWVMLES